jgi:hypothetical protein
MKPPSRLLGRHRPGRPAPLAPLVALVVTATAIAFPASAAGQSGPGAAPPKPAATVAPQAKAEAERHFKRGLELFDDDDFQGARIEFGRAYQLLPNFHVLYNLGQVNFQLQDYVAALHAFEKYLAEGGDTLSRERREEVSRDVAKLRNRVASVVVTATAGATITVDGAFAGTAPLEAPLQVSAGKRVIRALMPSRTPVEKTMELAGGDTARIDLTLDEPKVAAAVPAPNPIAPALAPTPDPAPESSKPPWALWGITGALAVGTAVTGVVAVTASSSASDIRSGGGSFADYQNAEERMHTFSIVTDIVGATTIVVAGLAMYFTLASGSKKTGSVSPASSGPSVALGANGAPGGSAFSFRF